MKIIVTGATGMVGAEVIRQAIQDQEIESITAISRNPIATEHPKLSSIIHHDFLNYDTLDEIFKENDAVIWCLGISQSQVSKAKYEERTYDYTMAAAKAMFDVNPKSTFLFLSGAGADTSEKSNTIFARVKGKTENALSGMLLLKLFIVRPAGINPKHENPNTSFWNKLMIPLFPLFKLILPSYVIDSDVLARAMLQIAKKGASKTLIENIELKKLGGN